MKKAILIILLFYSSLLWRGAGREVCAQDKHLIDSLQQQLANHNATKLELGKNISPLYDTIQANLLNNLTNAWMDFNNDSAMTYANHLLKLSEKMRYKKGIANSASALGLIMQGKGDFPAALVLHRRALKIRDEIEDKNGLAASTNNIGAVYLLQDNYPEALKYFFYSNASERANRKQRVVSI